MLLEEYYIGDICLVKSRMILKILGFFYMISYLVYMYGVFDGEWILGFKY